MGARNRKYSKKRNPHQLFLVICEGETERVYVEALKRHYRLPINIKVYVRGNTINQRAIDQYIHENSIDKEKQCRLFFIYDYDIDEIVEKVKKLEGTCIFSNPCIELWYILHAANYSRSISSKEAVRILSGYEAWKNYSKGVLRDKQLTSIIEHKEEATARAKELNYPQNPSTNMWKFIEALEDEKRNK